MLTTTKYSTIDDHPAGIALDDVFADAEKPNPAAQRPTDRARAWRGLLCTLYTSGSRHECAIAISEKYRVGA